MGREATLERDHRLDRARRIAEREEEPVTGVLDHLTAVLGHDGTHRLVVPPQDGVPRRVAERLAQPGRVDDVGEGERLQLARGGGRRRGRLRTDAQLTRRPRPRDEAPAPRRAARRRIGPRGAPSPRGSGCPPAASASARAIRARAASYGASRSVHASTASRRERVASAVCAVRSWRSPRAPVVVAVIAARPESVGDGLELLERPASRRLVAPQPARSRPARAAAASDRDRSPAGRASSASWDGRSIASRIPSAAT